MKFHKTKDGKKIKLCHLQLTHLQNIIRLIERRAVEGVVVRSGGGSCPDDFWCDEDEIYGDEAKEYLNYSIYQAELERRTETESYKIY